MTNEQIIELASLAVEIGMVRLNVAKVETLSEAEQYKLGVQTRMLQDVIMQKIDKFHKENLDKGRESPYNMVKKSSIPEIEIRIENPSDNTKENTIEDNTDNTATGHCCQ